MERVPFGLTGLTVTRLGLGLAALGRPAYITRGRTDDLGADRSRTAMERRAHGVLDRAYAAGFRYVDAARSYGDAEAFLASWLDRQPPGRDDITIGSKWGYTYTGGWRLDADVHEMKDLSANALRRQIGESRSHLGARLHLYQVHSATIESGVLEDEAVLATLMRLRQEGLTIGLSVSGPAQAETIRGALAVRVDGVNLFQAVQATWNLLEPSAAGALAAAHDAGWGVIVKEAVANGRLTDRDESRETAALRAAARSLGAPLDALAIAAALSHRWVDVVLCGAVTPGQLASNVRAFDVIDSVESLPDARIPPADYWSARSRLSWD